MSRYQDPYSGQPSAGMAAPNSHAYPPLNSPPSFHSTAPGHEYSSMHGTPDGAAPYGSQPGNPPSSLPRYQSSQNQQQRGPATRNNNGRMDSSYSTQSSVSDYGKGSMGPNGPHPLSNAVFADSSPTLHESLSTSEEYKKGMASPTTEKSRLNSAYDTPKAGFGSKLSGAFVAGKSADEVTMVKRKRLGYLDGLKFICACIVLNATFFDAVSEDDNISLINSGAALYFVRSFSVGLSGLLLLSGRSLIEPLWEVASSSKNAEKPGPVQPTVAWYRLSRALLVRPFRFILPVLVVAALQWGLGATGRTANSRNAGINEPYWGEIRSFAGYATLVFDLFTVFDADPITGQTFAANLWTVPWFFQSSYCVYVTHIMLGNLSSNRYWIYAALAFFSWTSFNFFYVAILGLAICDMAAHGQFEKIHRAPFLLRVALQVSVAAVGIAVEVVPVIRDNLSDGLAHINVTDLVQIRFADTIFVTCMLLVVEMNPWIQFILGNVVMRMLGKLSAGLYLLAPAMTFTVIPDLAISMSNSGSGSSAILGVSWVVLFLSCFGLAIVFYFLVELPSKFAGEFFADFCTNSEDTASAAIKNASKRVAQNVRAPNSAPARLKKLVS